MKEVISDTLIESHFNAIKRHLVNNKNRVAFILSRDWCKTIPRDAGVYCFFIDNKLAYVGETGCLRKRMSDLLDTRNHTLRRSIGLKYFSTEKGFIQATSQSKFPEHIESLIEAWMIKHLKVAWLAVSIGRKEFEEWLQQNNSEVEFLNKRKKRKG